MYKFPHVVTVFTGQARWINTLEEGDGHGKTKKWGFIDV